MLLVPMLLAVVVVGGGAAALVFRWPSLDPASPRVARHSAQKVEASLVRERGLRNFLVERTNPATATGLLLTVALAIIIVGGFVVGVLAVLVHGDSAIVSVDHTFSQWASDHASRVALDVLRAITQLGATEVVIGLAVVVLVVEHVRRPSRWILPFLAVVLVGEGILTNAIKELIARVRPDLNPAAHLLGPSFPSGHTATAAAFWAAVALLMGRGRGRRAHALLVGAAVAIAVAVACTRVLLDVHWFSDVVAGLALDWAWFAVSAIAFGGRLLIFGAPVEAAERAVTVPEAGALVAAGAPHAARSPVRVEQERVDDVEDRPKPE